MGGEHAPSVGLDLAIAGPIFFRQVAHAAGSSPSATAASPLFLTPPIHNHVEQAFQPDLSLERLSCKMRPPASSPLGDLRRHRFLRTRTSCSSGWRVVPARIPARGGEIPRQGPQLRTAFPSALHTGDAVLRPPHQRRAFSASRNTLIAWDELPPDRQQKPCPCLRPGHGFCSRSGPAFRRPGGG